MTTSFNRKSFCNETKMAGSWFNSLGQHNRYYTESIHSSQYAEGCDRTQESTGPRRLPNVTELTSLPVGVSIRMAACPPRCVSLPEGFAPMSDRSSTPTRTALSSGSDRTTFRIALDGAKRVLKRRFRVLLLARDAYTRMSDHSRALTSVKEDLAVLLRMMTAWAQRSYQRVPWTVLLLVTGAVVYFVAPIDLIPDALIGIGFVDDVAVVTAVVRTVRDELDRFRAWEQDHPSLGNTQGLSALLTSGTSS